MDKSQLRTVFSTIGVALDIRDLGSLAWKVPGMIASGTAIPAFIKWLDGNVPDLSLVLFGIAGVMAIPVLFSLRRFLPHKEPNPIGELTSQVPFWLSRNRMQDETGGLNAELDEVGNAWVSFETGLHYVSMSPERQKKIRRLVLLHPDCEFLEVWTHLDQSTGRARETIKEATTKALQHDTQVRWTKAPMLNAVFGEPGSATAWVRIQSQFPYVNASYWPNYKIFRTKQPSAFDKALESYETMWDEGEEPPR